MATYTQAGRPLVVSTPLGKDALLLVGFMGTEAISSLFSFDLDLLTEPDVDVPFEKLLGQPIDVELTGGGGTKRQFHGICVRISQGDRRQRLNRYRMQVAPAVWKLTLRHQSRIFQQMSVPDVLKKVLAGFDVSFSLQGTFEPRDYVAQYRESDFDFASRLMEEEGIWYLFEHKAGSHRMVICNTPQGHSEVGAPATLVFEDTETGGRVSERVFEWEKTQEMRSGKTTLWDHSFEMPGKNLESVSPVIESAQAGTATHKLQVGGNDKLEVYDYPGAYAQRFDGIDPGGGERAGDLSKVQEDGKRTAKLRMDEETAAALVVRGSSNCVQLSAGRKFTLSKHFAGDGAWVLTRVEHLVSCGAGYATGEQGADFSYTNTFGCIPFAVPYRPARVTPRPFVRGAQTAVVVGPSGDEIFTDKYGRVKVQFPWDRDGKKNASSSCWVRVGTHWAGKQWGAIHIPRIGQEVVVAFLEGDPDQPIVVGSVYNADQMPPYTLPDNKTQSGLKSRSSPGGDAATFNELRFEDKKDAEEIYFHAETDFNRVVENNDSLKVGMDKKDPGTQTIDVWGDRTETVHDGNESVTIKKGNRTVTIEKGNEQLVVTKGTRTIEVKGDDKLTISSGNQATKVSAGKMTIEAAQSIELKVGSNTITIDTKGIQLKGMDIGLKADMGLKGEAGTNLDLKGGMNLKGEAGMNLDLKGGMNVKIEGGVSFEAKAPMATVKGDAMLTLKGGVTMIN